MTSFTNSRLGITRASYAEYYHKTKQLKNEEPLPPVTEPSRSTFTKLITSNG